MGRGVRKRVLWLVVSCLMVVSLVLASCAPATPEEKETTTGGTTTGETTTGETTTGETTTGGTTTGETTTGGTTTAGEVTATEEEEPKYGGTLNIAVTADMTSTFDARTYLTLTPHSSWSRIAHEQLLVPDPFKGPAGTGEWTGRFSTKYPPELMTGNLAESWEITLPDTIKLKIREGVHWQDRPPMNGAEMTPEDVVYNYIMWWGHENSNTNLLYPAFPSKDLETLKEHIYIDPDDPRTVVIKGDILQIWMNIATMYPVMFGTALGPIEEALKGPGYGDATTDVVGTGAMIWGNHVKDNYITFTSNPNYWKKDVLHNNNQLPYIDGMKIYIMPDFSARMAALRTGKIDIMADISLDNAQELWDSNPELQWTWDLPYRSVISLRHDVYPTDDVNVRRALMLAIDNDAIVNDLYGGEAFKWWWPAMPVPEQVNYLPPLEEMPEDVQELFEYHPDKARQLLADAGLPDGFKTSVIVDSSNIYYVEIAEVVASYWADIGVDLEIQLKEPGVVARMRRDKSYENGIVDGPGWASFDQFLFERKGNIWNQAMSDIPLIEEMYSAIMLDPETWFDSEKHAQVYLDNQAELHRNVIAFLMPMYKLYNFWQPWLGGYHGEDSSRYLARAEVTAEYVWIDQDLKRSLGK